MSCVDTSICVKHAAFKGEVRPFNAYNWALAMQQYLINIRSHGYMYKLEVNLLTGTYLHVHIYMYILFSITIL